MHAENSAVRAPPYHGADPFQTLPVLPGAPKCSGKLTLIKENYGQIFEFIGNLVIMASERKKGPKWHIIYYALAAFDILAVSSSLYLSHEIMGIYRGSVKENHVWAERVSALTKLGGMAQETNAPGNDVFDTKAVEKERNARNKGLISFHELLMKIRADIENKITGGDQRKLIEKANIIGDAMDQMVLEADQIFSFFESGEAGLAGTRMASMDRKYADLTNNIAAASQIVQSIQERNFNQQLTEAADLRRFEYLIGGCIVLMVGCITVYGHKIAVVMRKSHEELEAQGEELRQHRDQLEELIQQRTSELNQQTEKLVEALEREKENSRMQRQFVTMVSHEFRTPLTIIDGSAQRVMRRGDRITPEDLTERMGKIRSAVVRMNDLIASTLDSARIGEGNATLDLHSCRIKEIVHEVCERQQDISPNHNIQLDLNGLPDEIIADPKQLDHVFTNLMSNAVKYSPDSPLIRVGGGLTGTDAFIAVADNGVGIPDEDLPKMFTRFFRARTSSGISGTGIGLNLVKTLIDMHQGRIELKSEVGKGTVFTVFLPVGGPTVSETAAPADEIEAIAQVA